jgi:hypothetical protein
LTAKDPRRRALANPEACVFLLALAVRALLLVQWSRAPYYLFPQLDDQVNLLWAREIFDGRWLRERAFYQSPLYPYLSALVFSAAGWRPAAMLWLQAAAGALSWALLARAPPQPHRQRRRSTRTCPRSCSPRQAGGPRRWCG